MVIQLRTGLFTIKIMTVALNLTIVTDFFPEISLIANFHFYVFFCFFFVILNIVKWTT